MQKHCFLCVKQNITSCLKSLCWLIRRETFQFNNNWLNRINQSRIQCSECVKVRSSSWSTNICNGERSRRRANRTTPEAAQRKSQLCWIRNPKYYWFSLSTMCGCWWRTTGKIKTCSMIHCSTFLISLCMLNMWAGLCLLKLVLRGNMNTGNKLQGAVRALQWLYSSSHCAVYCQTLIKC